jgi:hypothetical protein
MAFSSQLNFLARLQFQAIFEAAVHCPPTFAQTDAKRNREPEKATCARKAYVQNLGQEVSDLSLDGPQPMLRKSRPRVGEHGVQRVTSKPVRRFSNTQAGSEPFGKFSTLLLFSTGYKSVDLIRSVWKRFVLIVQPLQFHDSLVKSRFWACEFCRDIFIN